MNFAIFTIGGLTGISGLIAMLIHVHLCQRIVVATRSHAEKLESTDIWANWRQPRKMRILKNIIRCDPDAVLRAEAKKALKYEKLSYLLWVSGMVLMGLGATLSK